MPGRIFRRGHSGEGAVRPEVVVVLAAGFDQFTGALEVDKLVFV